MKTITIVLAALSFETGGLIAQTGIQTMPPIAAPAPAMSAPVQAESAQPRTAVRPRKNVARNTDKSVAPSATPAPPRNRQNTHPRATPARPPVAAISYADALKRQHHQRHDRQWWTTRYRVIVLVNNIGYYYWDAGYWFPAYGYDPGYEYYDYNGPIYTYGDLLPDQVIYNVQRALKDLGYYAGPLTGSYSGATRAAIAAFQQDNDLDATGAIDEPTVEALGLY